MPVDSSFGGSSYMEPQAVFTGCICPNVRPGGSDIHELSCPTQPLVIKKPALYAGKRAWRAYLEQSNNKKG